MKKRGVFLKTIIILITLLFLPNIMGREVLGKEKLKVFIDAGHQSEGDYNLEYIAPWSKEKKPRVSGGTRGVFTKNKEYEINLEVALILRELLILEGYEVFMSRDKNNVSLSNRERAEMANLKRADIFIKLHCDGSKDQKLKGASILVPSYKREELKPIYSESKKYGDILKNTLEDGGIKVRGIYERDDITGFNWSKVPVILLEMGFMTNYEEDVLLGSKLYQEKIAYLIVKSLKKYSLSI